MGINKIEIFGSQTCGYINVVDGVLSVDERNKLKDIEYPKHTSMEDEPTEEESMWTSKTKLLALFNNNLSGGGSKDGFDITNWSLYRKKNSNNYLEFVKKVLKDDKFVVDYLTQNQVSYTYYLFPDTDSYIGSPITSNQITADWWNWTLMVVNPTSSYKHYVVDKIYQFDLNLSTSDMNNNLKVNKLENFTQYPKIQKSPSNHWSGQLKSLIGYVSSYNNKYIDSIELMNELKALSTDSRKKFLKDRKGNIWEVDITESISLKYTDEASIQPVEMTLGWTEVGGIEGVSITNSTTASTQFVLTSNGIPTPDVNYQWLASGIWDNKRYWTPNY